MPRVSHAVLVLMVLGCSTPTTYWRNNNAGVKWETDLYQCTQAHSTTITSGGGTGLAGAISAGEVGSTRTDYAMRDLCLKSRGWYQVASQTSAPPSPPVVVPPAPAVSSAPVATQDAWMLVAKKGLGRAWVGVLGKDASTRSECEDRRSKFLQNPTNSGWELGGCRSTAVSFQQGPEARFGPGWAVVGAKAFIGSSTEQACTEVRGKLMAANPNQTFGACRQIWLSSDPDR